MPHSLKGVTNVKRIPTEIEQALDATGLGWALEKGSRHMKIKLAGRLVGILPHGSGNDANYRTIKNSVAQIRRAAQELCRA